MADQPGWGEGAPHASEDALIARLAELVPTSTDGLLLGIGDDAALIAPDLVWTVDTQVEGVHFDRTTFTPADVGRFESEFLEHLAASNPGILSEIRDSQKLSEDAEASLVAAVADFKNGFATSDGSSVVPNAHVAAMDQADVEKESVKVRKPAPKKK